MEIKDIIVLALIAILLYFALRGALRRAKQGGCCKNCAGCQASADCKSKKEESQKRKDDRT